MTEAALKRNMDLLGKCLNISIMVRKRHKFIPVPGMTVLNKAFAQIREPVRHGNVRQLLIVIDDRTLTAYILHDNKHLEQASD